MVPGRREVIHHLIRLLLLEAEEAEVIQPVRAAEAEEVAVL